MFTLHCQRLGKRAFFLTVIFTGLALGWLAPGATGQGGSVVVVSAASFLEPVAPESIATAFGLGLATNTVSASTQPLPTSLAGTTVRVNGREASLFFVSPEQVNFLVPPQTELGMANVEVRAGNGAVSRGTMRVSRIAPGVFTINTASGLVPAAVVLRVRANGEQVFEPTVVCDPAPCVPRPIDISAPGEQVFLALFVTGLRQTDQSLRVVIGGVEQTVAFAPAPGFSGLEQINLRLARELVGRGRVNLSVVANEAFSSSDTLIEIAPPPGVGPRVDAVDGGPALPGQRLTIRGSGFAATTAGNTVRVGGVEARVVAATPTQLIVEVPFGVRLGRVSVRTAQGEGASQSDLPVRTSISGFVTDTLQQPLRNVPVTARILDAPPVTRMTDDNGSFVLPDLPIPAGRDFATAEVECNSMAIPSPIRYPSVIVKLRAHRNQDNQIGAPVALQQVTGPGSNLAAGGPTGGSPASILALAPQITAQLPIRLQAGDVVLEIPAGAVITFPAGVTSRQLNLTVVERSRAPANLPPGIFSSRIVQLTPFGTTISPGGKFTFPNPDGLGPMNSPQLFRFDQTSGSLTLGEFVRSGAVTVSGNRQIETEANAAREGTYYFVSAPQRRTVVIGRVVEDDAQQTPVRQALFQTRGQNDFSDGHGGFNSPDVAVKAGDSLQVTASFQRPNGRIDVFDRVVEPAEVKVDGITNVGNLRLPQPDSPQPPVLLAPLTVTLSVNQMRDERLTAYTPDSRDPVDFQFSFRRNPTGAARQFFQLIRDDATGNHTLRFTPILTPDTDDVGEYTLTIVALNRATPPLSVRRDIIVTVTGLPGEFNLNQPTVACDTSLPSGPAVRLSWTPSSLAAAYDVFRDGVLVSPPQGLPAASLSYQDKIGLTAGMSYRYRVTARNAAGSRNADPNPLIVNILANVCDSSQVTIGIEPATGATGSIVTIPVLLGDATGRGVISYEFDLAFNPAVLQFQGLDQANTLSSAMTIEHNPDTPGKLRVAAAVANALTGLGRTLLLLKFRVVGARGAMTELRWEKLMLNEGDPPANKINGNFTVN